MGESENPRLSLDLTHLQNSKVFATFHGPFWRYLWGMNLDVVYSDAHLAVLNKPSGLLSVPGRGDDKQDCLISRAQRIWPDALTVHRLDMATSGLMLMARSLQVQRALAAAFEARQVRKRYQALVHGQLPLSNDWQEIRLPLAADWPRRPLQRVDAEHGKPSLTRWQALGHEGPNAFVECRPLTGRTHQLRVHLAAAGAPILFDPFYGHPGVTLLLSDLKRGYKGREDEQPLIGRLALHASALTLKHPVTREPFTLTAALPHEFEVALKYLRKFAAARA